MENSVLARIKAHSDPTRIRRLEVPEWGTPEVRDPGGNVVTPGAPMVIEYSMVTLDDLSFIQSIDGDDLYKRSARIVCMKARDPSGKPIFQMGDALELRQSAAPEVVVRVGLAIAGRVSMEDAEKN